MDAIPVINDPKCYKRQDFKHSRFVEITSDENFDVQMQYLARGMKYAEKQCYVREEVYEMLLKASKTLPRGYKFCIWDAWRPFLLQHELYDSYSLDIIREFELEECAEEQKKQVIRRFVSDPIPDKSLPPVHATGGAVDLTIIDDKGNELDMGTGFDAFTDMTNTAAFEDKKNKEVRENRRLLYHIMTDAGFTNLPSEWWHYDYGDRFWGFYKDEPAIYEGVFTRDELYGL